MPTAPVQEIPAFVIRETSGRKRTVALTSRGLPLGPLELKGTQRVKITNPVGNPEGWGNVMGPKEGETSIAGFWKDKYIGDTSRGGRSPIEMTSTSRGGSPASGTGPGSQIGTQVTSCVDAVALFDSIRREGQLLEVTWGYLIRRGYLTEFGQKWHNVHDCEWTAKFEWVSQARANASPEYGPPAGQLEAGSALRELLRSFSRILDTPGQIIGPMMEDFRNTVNRINDFSRTADDAVSGFSQTASLADIGSTLQSLFGSAAAAAAHTKDVVEANGWPLLFSDPQRLLPFTSYLAPPTDTAGADAAAIAALEEIDPEKVVQMQLYVRETISDARRLRDEAVIRQRALMDGPALVIGTYRAREGEDLRDVSVRYYGTTHQWRAIMIYNGLTDTECYAGQLIAIPNMGVSPEENG